ncbi:hypothetical protein BZA77DRAFT_98541 [Pyronema omphalodes]|nr:hypothetical protein BZA77DRAFT_98541 [Pyronema omphalodes]
MSSICTTQSRTTPKANDNSKPPPAVWDSKMTKRLIDILLEEVALGKRSSEGAFIRGSYERATKEINEKEINPDGGPLNLEPRQVKTKVGNIKKDLEDFLFAKNFPGATWDATNRCIIADSAVWQRIFAVNPRCKKYRGRPLESYDELLRLFNGTLHSEKQSGSFPSRQTSQMGLTTPATPGWNVDLGSPDVDDSQSLPDVQLDSRPLPTPQTPASVNRGVPAPDEISDADSEAEVGGLSSTPAVEGINIRKRRRTSTETFKYTKEADELLSGAVSLVKHFYHYLVDEEMVAAWNVMYDLKKARLFMSMPMGKARDLWLADEIEDKIEEIRAKKRKRRETRAAEQNSGRQIIVEQDKRTGKITLSL